MSSYLSPTAIVQPHVMFDHSLSLMQRKQHGYVFAKLCFQVKSYEDAFR